MDSFVSGRVLVGSSQGNAGNADVKSCISKYAAIIRVFIEPFISLHCGICRAVFVRERAERKAYAHVDVLRRHVLTLATTHKFVVVKHAFVGHRSDVNVVHESSPT